MKYTTENVMNELDKWVASHGSGEYVPEDFEMVSIDDWAIPEDWGMQQVRSEIKDFASLLLSKGKLNTILEIGLGHFGSTHFLWRLIFDKVVTIESQNYKVRAFGENTRKYAGHWALEGQKSSFLIGKSTDTSVVARAYDLLSCGIDVLFIDATHFYNDVLADWLIYSPLVKKGGIVAIHDAASKINEKGVPQFIKNLSRGHIDRHQYDVKFIVHSKEVGIAYYQK